MQIGPDTIRTIVERPLSQSELEGLLRGMEAPFVICEAIGHHTEDSVPRRSAAVEAFRQGLSCYRRREWKHAARCFHGALEANPDDGPSRVHLERCDIFRGSPPAAGWDGVWSVQSKY